MSEEKEPKAIISDLEKELVRRAKTIKSQEAVIKDQKAEITHLKSILRKHGVYHYTDRHGRAVWNTVRN